MFGVALAAVSNLFQEISASIGKREVQNGTASVYTYGFLSMLFAVLSGRLYFKEQHFLARAALLALLVTGLVLIVV